MGFDLAAFDLDGTLLPRDLVISGRTIEALDELRERGMRLVVATGRRFEGAREYAGQLGFFASDPVICYGGAMVREMGGETLLHDKIPTDVSAEVLEWAARRNLHSRIFTDGKIVTSAATPSARTYLRITDDAGGCAVDSPADWLRESGERPTKLVLVDHPDDIQDWLEEARQTFGERLFVTRSLPHYVEVGGITSNKSSALEFVCKYWNIEPSRTVAFGDADNDIDMLRFVGRGVAVGGKNEEVRAAADVVVPSVDEDGVAGYLEQLMEGSV
ncbi:MAG: Cof-type HAD-IIB family hydrolase [Rubrobacteraceae bacterium]